MLSSDFNRDPSPYIEASIHYPNITITDEIDNIDEFTSSMITSFMVGSSLLRGFESSGLS